MQASRLNLIYSVHELSNGWKLHVSCALTKVVVLSNAHRSCRPLHCAQELRRLHDGAAGWTGFGAQMGHGGQGVCPGGDEPYYIDEDAARFAFSQLHFSPRRPVRWMKQPPGARCRVREDVSDSKTTSSRKNLSLRGGFKFN
jgi:hypothetical protein